MPDSHASSNLTFTNGLWLGHVASRYGKIELVLDGTPESPNPNHIAAIQYFMPTAGQTIERLRKRLSLPLLWRPVRLAPNNENCVGVQFKHRLSNRQKVLFAAEN
jgi:hypothetical protein